MHITKVCLSNIARFESLEIDLKKDDSTPSNVTVFIGNNGAGKTSIVKSIATSLSWLVARIKTERGSGSPIPEEVITNGKSSAKVELYAENQGRATQWAISKARKGHKKGEHVTDLEEITALSDRFREELSNSEYANLPLVAFYSVERVVVDIPIKIRTKHTFGQVDGYDNSLTSGVDFRRFFEWFREREDVENEGGFPSHLVKDFLDKNYNSQEDKDAFFEKLTELHKASRDKQLNAVRHAIYEFMPNFKNLCIKRRPLHMSVDKKGKPFNVLQLSQGEKSLMALVGDIARRLAMMNPSLENPLQGYGIILIDEIDMHLHPRWQRNIIERLTRTFPNCQFILTTHSPLVISDYKDMLLYSLDDGIVNRIPSIYGDDANMVLVEQMNTGIRNSDVQKKLDKVLNLIQDRKIEESRAILQDLKKDISENNIEIIKAEILIRKQELRNEKNQ